MTRTYRLPRFTINVRRLQSMRGGRDLYSLQLVDRVVGDFIVNTTRIITALEAARWTKSMRRAVERAVGTT